MNELRGHSRFHMVTFVFKNLHFLFCLKSNRLIVTKLFMNASNILETQIFHKMKYALKGH